jgi:quercetin dioxygenase-like cupin family protein
MGDNEMTQTPAEYVDGSADVTSLTDLGAHLLTQAHERPARRAAKTVISGTHQRATLLALAANTDLAEHDAPPAATLQIITGQVRLYTTDREWLLHAGHLVAIPPHRHSLHASTDAVVLLTVALH